LMSTNRGMMAAPIVKYAVVENIIGMESGYGY
jgi:hypothetical protein